MYSIEIAQAAMGTKAGKGGSKIYDKLAKDGGVDKAIDKIKV
jgi:hypothetical protein